MHWLVAHTVRCAEVHDLRKRNRDSSLNTSLKHTVTTLFRTGLPNHVIVVFLPEFQKELQNYTLVSPKGQSILIHERSPVQKSACSMPHLTKGVNALRT